MKRRRFRTTSPCLYQSVSNGDLGRRSGAGAGTWRGRWGQRQDERLAARRPATGRGQLGSAGLGRAAAAEPGGGRGRRGRGGRLGVGHGVAGGGGAAGAGAPGGGVHEGQPRAAPLRLQQRRGADPAAARRRGLPRPRRAAGPRPPPRSAGGAALGPAAGRAVRQPYFSLASVSPQAVLLSVLIYWDLCAQPALLISGVAAGPGLLCAEVSARGSSGDGP